MMNRLISDRRSMDLPTRVRTSSESLITRSLSAGDTVVVDDTFAPSRFPREKVIYGKQWDWHPKGSENTFEFDEIGIWDTLSKLKCDILIFYKGYKTPVRQHSVRNEADIISLIPVEETPTGITLSRPRAGGEWTMKGIHCGVRDKRDMMAIQLLQEAGIDVEGLQLVGRLKKAIKISFDIQKTKLEMSFDDIKQLLRNKIYKVLIK